MQKLSTRNFHCLPAMTPIVTVLVLTFMPGTIVWLEYGALRVHASSATRGEERVSTITHIDGASATSFDGWC
jgi:hypothetical protein